MRLLGTHAAVVDSPSQNLLNMPHLILQSSVHDLHVLPQMRVKKLGMLHSSLFGAGLLTIFLLFLTNDFDE